MVLFVYYTLMRENFKESRAHKKSCGCTHPFCFEGITMVQLVSSSKGEALHLKAIRDVKRDEDKDFLEFKLAPLTNIMDCYIGMDVQFVYSICSREKKGKIRKQALAAFPVGPLHQFQHDSIG